MGCSVRKQYLIDQLSSASYSTFVVVVVVEVLLGMLKLLVHTYVDRLLVDNQACHKVSPSQASLALQLYWSC